MQSANDALGRPFQDIEDKVANAKTNLSSAIDKGTSRVKETWNASPLHNILSGGPTTIDNSKSNLKPSAPKAAPATINKLPKFHDGTDYVPKTGPAILKKGEAVLNTADAAKHRAKKGKTMTKVNAMSGAQDALGGKKTPKAKKEIKHIKTEKAKSGGFIHTHVHTHPEDHPDEQHVTPDQDGMVNHMLQHMGTPNPGEAEADASSGAGAPAMGAPAMGAPDAA